MTLLYHSDAPYVDVSTTRKPNEVHPIRHNVTRGVATVPVDGMLASPQVLRDQRGHHSALQVDDAQIHLLVGREAEPDSNLLLEHAGADIEDATRWDPILIRRRIPPPSAEAFVVRGVARVVPELRPRETGAAALSR